MANLYYLDALNHGVPEAGALAEVTGEEARHAVRVSRLRVGEEILVGDGRGTIAAGTVEETAKDRFTVRIETVRRDPDPVHRLVLVQALAKGDRDERAVEQATEFGVDAIVPWQAARSVSRWDGAGGTEKAAKGVAKWRRIAREASKQSMRAWIPEVRDPVTLDGLCALAGRDGVELVVLHPGDECSLSEWTRQRRHLGEWAAETCVVIGPEGGFAEHELEALMNAGASVCVLGSTVLRTSSAGPAALAVLSVALGRW